MSAKKISLKNPSYGISMSKHNFEKKDSDFLGKLTTNFGGNVCEIFDNGKKSDKTSEIEKVRKSLGAIFYVLKNKLINLSN